MEKRLVEFVEVLRQNGLRVSPLELKDALLALSEIDLANASSVKAALKCTLCKRERDSATFEKAFFFFFSGAARAFRDLDKSLAQQLDEHGLLEGDELKMVLATLPQLAGQLAPMTNASLSGNRSAMANIFRDAALRLDFSAARHASEEGFFYRRFWKEVGGEKTRRDIDFLVSEFRQRGLSHEGLEVVAQELGARLRRLEELAKSEVSQHLQATQRNKGLRAQEKAFRDLSPRELEQAQAAARRLAQKLKTRMSRRLSRRRHGRLAVRKTLRGNMGWEAIPMVPHFSRKVRRRPDVVVLCDISESVRNASRVMMLFMHSLQTLFVRVRSFVFVSELGEVTSWFKSLPTEEALEKAVSGLAVSMRGNSHYGNVFSTFAQTQMGHISPRTTVLILGDGRSNYNPSHVNALWDMRQKCKRLIWLCTEDASQWGMGDSDMVPYARACHQVVTVQTVEDLEKVAFQIMPVS